MKSSVYKKVKYSYINYLALLYGAYPADILLEVYSINLKIPRTLYVVHWSSKKMHPILHKYVVESIKFHAWKVCKIEGAIKEILGFKLCGVRKMNEQINLLQFVFLFNL